MKPSSHPMACRDARWRGPDAARGDRLPQGDLPPPPPLPGPPSIGLRATKPRPPLLIMNGVAGPPVPPQPGA